MSQKEIITSVSLSNADLIIWFCFSFDCFDPDYHIKSATKKKNAQKSKSVLPGSKYFNYVYVAFPTVFVSLE